MEFFIAQLEQTLRRLRRAPLFTFLTLLMLAAGVGANVAIFSVVEGVLLKPLPYPQPEQLVNLAVTPLGLGASLRGMSPSDYFTFSEQNHSFTDMGIYSGDSVNVTGVATPERLRAMVVTDGALAALRIAPLVGRLFSQSDCQPGAPLTAVLTYSYWQRHFGGSRSAVGKTLIVDGKSRQIIGVLPRLPLYRCTRFVTLPALSV